MPGKLIVIDGLDGSGKTTQSQRVAQALERRGTPVRLISFPDYAEESSALVRMYLNGELSDTPGGVNAYAASSFYAVDRYASFKKHWEKDYLAGHTILSTRYVSSNAIHQMSKLPENQWDEYLRWLSDFEYGRLGLPRPDRIISVSYTHLDVYKRQAPASRSVCRFFSLARLSFVGGRGRTASCGEPLDRVPLRQNVPPGRFGCPS